MTKEFEAFENIIREAGNPYFSSLYDIDDWHDDIAIIKKTLKAVQIIRNHKLLNPFKNEKLRKMYGLSNEKYLLIKEAIIDD